MKYNEIKLRSYDEIYNIQRGFMLLYEKTKKKDLRLSKIIYSSITEDINTTIRCRVSLNTGHIGFFTEFRKISHVGNENKSCSNYLGIYISEQILSYIYINVKRMPHNNIGYDFICGKGYKVDVKSSCERKNYNTWEFGIHKNKIADYFLCLAFDNRDDLNPKHIWLIPGSIINDKTCATISESTLLKWEEYKQPLNKIISCCDTFRKINSDKNE